MDTLVKLFKRMVRILSEYARRWWTLFKATVTFKLPKIQLKKQEYVTRTTQSL